MGQSKLFTAIEARPGAMPYPAGTRRVHAAWGVVLAAVLACIPGGETSEKALAQHPRYPEGLSMPLVERPACPGEGCSFGEWLACDTVSVFLHEGDTTALAGRLLPGEPMTVHDGAVIVRTPGIVAVQRDGPRGFSQAGEVALAPGDTVYVLNYLGEGVFNAWVRDTLMEVEVFWPWDDWLVGDDHDYAGEVVQEADTEFWLRVAAPGGGEGFVLVDRAALAAANSLDPDPPVCRNQR